MRGSRAALLVALGLAAGCNAVLDLDRFEKGAGGGLDAGGPDGAVDAGDAGDAGEVEDGGPACECPDDGDPCTVEVCDDGGACVSAGLPDGTACGAADAICCRGVCGLPNTADACGPGCDVCAGGQACRDGACGCDPSVGFEDCDADDVCEDLSSDDAHCGRCGNACGAGQSCLMGMCGTCATSADCDDGMDCTVDQCDIGVCDRTGITPGTCRIGGICHDDGDPNPANPCERCDPTAPSGWSVDTSRACDDGDPCTVVERCLSDGTCGGGLPVGCSDGDPCTRDTCNSTTGACESTPEPDGTVAAGEHCCGGVVVDLDMDPNHCGGCGLRCGSGSCSNYRCLCTSVDQCPSSSDYVCDDSSPEGGSNTCRCFVGPPSRGCAVGQTCTAGGCRYP